MSRDIYREVTDRIMAALEEGTVPWRKPWNYVGEEGLQRNLDSNRPYRGINQWLLSLAGYDSPYWLTVKSLYKQGGKLKKINGADEPGTGQKATLVIFWKQIRVKDQDTEEPKTILLLKHYNVVNAEQCEGIEVPEPSERPEFDPIEEAATIIEEMPDAPPITHGGDSACYVPMFDEVRLPLAVDFKTPESYYATAFHELVHSTGHESRLARKELVEMTGFGDHAYSREELTAEFGASFLCGMAGIEPAMIDNAAAYIKNWLSALDNDPKMLVQAAARAHRAADFILGDGAEDHEAEPKVAIAA